MISRSGLLTITCMGGWIVVFGLLALGSVTPSHDGPRYTMGTTVYSSTHAPHTIIGTTYYQCTRIDGTYEEGWEYQCVPMGTHGDNVDVLIIDESDIHHGSAP